MKKLVVVFILAMIHQWSVADCIRFVLHEFVNVSAVITDDAGEPVPFATVAIYTGPEKKLVDGTVADFDGLACIDSVKQGLYTIEVASFGYHTLVYDSVYLGFSQEHSIDVELESVPVPMVSYCYSWSCRLGESAEVLLIDCSSVAVDSAQQRDQLIEPSTVHPYPNPTSDRFRLSAARSFESLEVVDMNGQVLRSFGNGSVVYDISDLPTGTYVIRWLEDAVPQQRRLVKL